MMRFATITQMLIRLFFVIQLVLGLCIWPFNIVSLSSIHMTSGSIFVLLLLVLAIIGLIARAGAGLALGLIVWGILLAGFGMAQKGIMPGSGHWVIRIIHLAIAMAAMPMAERLAARIKAPRATITT